MKRWLLGIAQRTAEAAKEGGFLGFGGAQVSETETRRDPGRRPRPGDRPARVTPTAPPR